MQCTLLYKALQQAVLYSTVQLGRVAGLRGAARQLCGPPLPRRPARRYCVQEPVCVVAGGRWRVVYCTVPHTAQQRHLLVARHAASVTLAGVTLATVTLAPAGPPLRQTPPAGRTEQRPQVTSVEAPGGGGSTVKAGQSCGWRASTVQASLQYSAGLALSHIRHQITATAGLSTALSPHRQQ